LSLGSTGGTPPVPVLVDVEEAFEDEVVVALVAVPPLPPLPLVPLSLHAVMIKSAGPKASK